MPLYGVWVQDDTDSADLHTKLDRCLTAGFTDVFYLVGSGAFRGTAGTLLPKSTAVTGPDPDWDCLGDCVTYGHSIGLKVHAWYCPGAAYGTNGGGTTGAFYAMYPDYDCVGNLTGGSGNWPTDCHWLNFNDTGAQQLVIDVCEEIATEYDVDGIHLDYIRFAAKDYTAGMDTYAYNYGAESAGITTVVGGAKDAVHAVRADCLVTAAVLQSAESGINCLQAWDRWVNGGSIDYVIPMLYTDAAHSGTVPYYIANRWGTLTYPEMVIGANAFAYCNWDGDAADKAGTVIQQELDYYGGGTIAGSASAWFELDTMTTGQAGTLLTYYGTVYEPAGTAEEPAYAPVAGPGDSYTVSIAQPPIRLSVYSEELQYRRDIFADAMAGDGLTHATLGNGSMTITLPPSHDMADLAQWERTLVVAYYPGLPPLPLVPIKPKIQLGLGMTVPLKDAGFLLDRRVVHIPPSTSINSDSLVAYITEALQDAPACPVRSVEWRGPDKDLDFSGQYTQNGKTVKEICDWVASEWAMTWYVTWEDEKALLVITPNDFTEVKTHWSTPKLIDGCEIAMDLEGVINRAVCTAFTGGVIGGQYVLAEDKESQARYGLREAPFMPHGQNPNPTEWIADLVKPQIEVPLSVNASDLDGAYLAHTVSFDLPGQRYKAILEGIGVLSDYATAVIKARVEEDE